MSEIEDDAVLAAAEEAMRSAAELEEALRHSPILPSLKNDPYQCAEHFLNHFFRQDGRYQFVYWREGWYGYWKGLWSSRSEEDVQKFIHNKLLNCRTIKGENVVPQSVSAANVNELMFQIRNIVTLPSHYRAPAVQREDGKWDEVSSDGKIVCRGKIVDMLSGEEFSNKFMFIPNGATWTYDDEAPEPRNWLAFLDSLKLQKDELHLLQEWMGYVLSGDLWAHKGLIIIGPPRAGKGIIGHVIRELLGDSMVTSPSLHHLGTPFGLEGLQDKRLCLISDARLSTRADMVSVVEVLLRLIAADSIGVQRKFKSTIEIQLPCRVMMLSNHLPDLSDSSEAIMTRFMIMNLRESWLGREDYGLKGRLLEELPSIAKWCVEGYQRLLDRGHFVEPSQSISQRKDWYHDANPLLAFVETALVVDPNKSTMFRRLYDAYKTWCEERHQPPLNPNAMSRRLTSIFGTQIRRSKTADNEVILFGVGMAGGTF